MSEQHQNTGGGQKSNDRKWLTDDELKAAAQRAKPFLVEATRVAKIEDENQRKKESGDFKQRWAAFRSNELPWGQLQPLVMFTVVVGTTSANEAYLILESWNAEAALAIRRAIELTGVAKPTKARDLIRPKSGQVNQFVQHLVEELEKKESPTATASLENMFDNVGQSEAGRLVYVLNGWSRRLGKFSTEGRQKFRQRREAERRARTAVEVLAEASRDPSEEEVLTTQIESLEEQLAAAKAAKKAAAEADDDEKLTAAMAEVKRLSTELSTAQQGLLALESESEEDEEEDDKDEITRLAFVARIDELTVRLAAAKAAKKAAAEADDDEKLTAAMAEVKRLSTELATARQELAKVYPSVATFEPETTVAVVGAASAVSETLTKVLGKLGELNAQDSQAIEVFVAGGEGSEPKSPAAKKAIEQLLDGRITSERFLKKARSLGTQGTVVTTATT